MVKCILLVTKPVLRTLLTFGNIWPDFQTYVTAKVSHIASNIQIFIGWSKIAFIETPF